MILLHELPVIIKNVGDFITRDGRKVTVHTLLPDSSPYTFKAKGTIWKVNKKGKLVPGPYDVWHVSGRNKSCNESIRDIIGQWFE